jgi:cellulose synthase/poly-beta-1,6-N-acetylglucosamine synthase-like glycosyltransferase
MGDVILISVAAIFMGSVGFALWQGHLSRKLANLYSRPTIEWPKERPFPHAAIILSLRGHDPFLEKCIRNLIHQDYPDFEIRIVIDSDTDPAWNAVNAIRSEYGHDRLVVSTLNNRDPSRSLKNSSIIEAIRGLPREIEVVALVDADAVVAPTWLRNLVAPLADPNVGCTTGIRWFAPLDNSYGSRLRCYWNFVAAPVIYASNTPWGGSMAVRRSVLDSGLTDDWSRMFCEDAHTINHMRRRGLKVEYVPEATVVNQETISVPSCIRFVNRQMLIFRLYNEG